MPKVKSKEKKKGEKFDLPIKKLTFNELDEIITNEILRAGLFAFILNDYFSMPEDERKKSLSVKTNLLEDTAKAILEHTNNLRLMWPWMAYAIREDAFVQ